MNTQGLKKVISLLLVLLLISLLGACNQETIGEKDGIEERFLQEKEETPVVGDTQPVEETELPSGLLESGQWPVPQAYRAYVLHQLPVDETYSVVYYGTALLKGTEIGVLALAESDDDWIKQVFVLQEGKEGVSGIWEGEPTTGYGVDEVRIINLRGQQEPFLYYGLTNGANLHGFQLSRLDQLEPEPVIYSASATGAGNDTILDQDGLYEGYVQNRWSYDVLYYDLAYYYSFEEDGAVLQDILIDLPAYPETPEEVVLQYISLNVLELDQSTTVQDRLAELYPHYQSEKRIVTAAQWYEATLYTLLGIEEGLVIEMIEEGDQAKITVFNGSLEGKQQVVFILGRQQNRWQIELIE